MMYSLEPFFIGQELLVTLIPHNFQIIHKLRIMSGETTDSYADSPEYAEFTLTPASVPGYPRALQTSGETAWFK